MPALTALLQDRWEVAPGFAFLVGLRLDDEFLPRSSIPQDQAWLTATGLANASIPSSIAKWSSRLGFDLRAGPGHGWTNRCRDPSSGWVRARSPSPASGSPAG